MASTIQSFLDNGRAYDMSSLLTMYQHILKSKGIDADSYTKHKLKLRMQSHFGDDIVFPQQFDKKKPELVYSSKMSSTQLCWNCTLRISKCSLMKLMHGTAFLKPPKSSNMKSKNAMVFQRDPLMSAI